MDAKAYRPDIDGLRAIAVLAVLAFHLDISGFQGGFTGVDIFFVISGFLITNLILKEITATGTFRFGRFYMRRVRRLFPALFVTQVSVLVTGAILLAPWDLERLGGALVHSLLCVSNFFFWGESGYFDTASSAKPLLHTWSLGVEEQFYLFWPLLLFLGARMLPRALMPWLLGAAAVVSFYLNFAFADGSVTLLSELAPNSAQRFSNGGATIFFLTPFRVFEFAIGALMVWLVPRQPQSNAVSEVALFLGFAAMAYGVFFFNKTTPFPLISALFPCIGAAFVIWAGEAKYTGHVLNNPVAVGIGKISYSLYLVHWPLIVFWKYYSLQTAGPVGTGTLAAASILLAVVMYRFVEQYFRYPAQSSGDAPARNTLFVTGCAALLVAALIPAHHMWTNEGWTWRLPKHMLLDNQGIRAELDKYWNEGIRQNEEFSDDTISAVVIGDSMALDVAYMLSNHPDTRVYYEGTTGHLCDAFTLPIRHETLRADRDCSQNIDRFKRDYPEADIVILADRGSTWDTTRVRNITTIMKNINLLRESGYSGPIVIYGERPTYSENVSQVAFRFGRVHKLETMTMKHITSTIPMMRERIEVATTYYEAENIHYYSPVRILCDSDQCEVLTPDNELIYFDIAHFTPEGGAYLVDDFVEYLKSIDELRRFGDNSP